MQEEKETRETEKGTPDGALVLTFLHGRNVTVKRFYREGNAVRLKWQKGEPREIVLPAEEVRVQGEVVRVIIEPGRYRVAGAVEYCNRTATGENEEDPADDSLFLKTVFSA